MKRFLLKIFLFLMIIFGFFVAGLLLPTTPRSKTSALASKLDKDKLLRDTPSPRLILVGGSNLSLGINSQIIKDELQVNPINTAIMVSVGLPYYLSNTLKYIKPGDAVLISPEYLCFYDHNFYGSEALLWTVFDFDRGSIKDLNWKQWLSIYKYLPRYAFSKFDPFEYRPSLIGPVYIRDNYNQYGDSLEPQNTRRKFAPFKKDEWPQRFDYFVLAELSDYERQLEAKGASVYFTFPGFQDKTYENNKLLVKKVELELKKHGFKVISSPERYVMPDKLMYDSPYHLLRVGSVYRTQLLIDDLRPYINLSNIK
jgi:hypothetical protein